MDTRIVDRPAFRLVGHAARVPLIHKGINLSIQRHINVLSHGYIHPWLRPGARRPARKRPTHPVN